MVAPDVFTPRALYDGQAIAYAPRELALANNGSGTFNVRLGENRAAELGARGTYQIRFTLTLGEQVDAKHVYDLIRERKTSTRALVATNLIQLIMRQGPNMHHTNNGRAHFTGNEKITLPNSGLELWRGTFLSVRPTMGKMILNVDTCSAAVYQSGPLIAICMQKLRLRDARELDLGERDPRFKTLEKFLKGLRMKVKTGGGRSRTQTIRGLVANAGEFSFWKDDTVEMTVADYFYQTHNIRLQYPGIIGVRLTPDSSPRKDVVPLELCELEFGQLFKRKLPDELTADMVRFSAMRPQERLRKIQAAAKETGGYDFVRESGMHMDINPMRIDAKLLDVPQLHFANLQKPLDITNGAWNVVRQRFTNPAKMKYWIVVSFVNNIDQGAIAQRMTSGGASLLKSCQNLEISPTPLIKARANPHDAAGVLYQSARQYSKQIGVPDDNDNFDLFLGQLMVIVILPTNAAGIRSAVKYWGDVKQGVATQCIRESKFDKANDQYWNNIALKINARLGGTNFFSTSEALKEIKSEPFMIMGADVGHPGPGVQKPSVTGIVYSYDQNATRYVALTGIQPPRVEQIVDLKKYVYRAINSFAVKNNGPPARLIFYRDGISEGEFNKVAAIEIGDIKEALVKVYKDNTVPANKPLPLLTYIVVGKRHHAVFFPGDQQGADPRNGNALAGSLIDSGITHPAVRDFYLQSHAAIQGTSRSSHYVVLHDENWNFNMKRVQQISYTLCYNYAKATRSVSIPAPVYSGMLSWNVPHRPQRQGARLRRQHHHRLGLFHYLGHEQVAKRLPARPQKTF
ncbi:Protein argonaute-3 [Psilocybe cubensis]|uniref:Protein argonaute-3 n=1 Tax=Psilocybe cubensis TaxID=181762 RepID=A0ACB8H6V3_PSICU|nr:Protein argonaute-3 [Psilocybe cubensis]KAH9483636.1 Protein argonaute-3 [Psilocybe cubensis]